MNSRILTQIFKFTEVYFIAEGNYNSECSYDHIF